MCIYVLYQIIISDVTMNCQPNQIFSHKCHDCVCDSKGNYAMCHGKECLDTDENRKGI